MDTRSSHACRDRSGQGLAGTSAPLLLARTADAAAGCIERQRRQTEATRPSSREPSRGEGTPQQTWELGRQDDPWPLQEQSAQPEAVVCGQAGELQEPALPRSPLPVRSVPPGRDGLWALWATHFYAARVRPEEARQLNSLLREIALEHELHTEKMATSITFKGYQTDAAILMQEACHRLPPAPLHLTGS